MYVGAALRACMQYATQGIIIIQQERKERRRKVKPVWVREAEKRHIYIGVPTTVALSVRAS